jgi:hypothetical protein
VTKHPDLFAALAAPFEPVEVKQRAGSGGRTLHYVTASTVANRLDSVLGPECWDFELKPWGDDALIGCLIVRLPDGSVLKKSNVGGCADMQSDDDATKSAASDCLKRCAATLGVGRYLYRDGVPAFVQGRQPATETALEHLPSNSEQSAPAAPNRERPQGSANGGATQGGGQGRGGQPRSGKAMFAWTKEQEQRHEVGLLKYLNGWAKLQEFPPRMIDWDENQVKAGYAEAVRKIQSIGGGQRPPDDSSYDEALANQQAPVGAADAGAEKTDPSAALAVQLDIGVSDPFNVLKLRIKTGAYELAVANNGGRAFHEGDKAAAIINQVDSVAAVVAGRPVGSLRACRDQELLEKVAAEIQSNLEAIRAARKAQAGPSDRAIAS